jgi:hypothetical protein
MSVDGSAWATFAFLLSLFEKLDVDRLRALDDVVVRDDVAGLVDHEARPEAPRTAAGATAGGRTGRRSAK